MRNWLEKIKLWSLSPTGRTLYKALSNTNGDMPYELYKCYDEWTAIAPLWESGVLRKAYMGIAKRNAACNKTKLEARIVVAMVKGWSRPVCEVADDTVMQKAAYDTIL